MAEMQLSMNSVIIWAICLFLLAYGILFAIGEVFNKPTLANRFAKWTLGLIFKLTIVMPLKLLFYIVLIVGKWRKRKRRKSRS